MTQPTIVHGYFAATETQYRAAEQQLAQAGYEMHWLLNDAEAVSAMANARYLACAQLPDINWQHAQQLALAHVMGSGVDHIDLTVLPDTVVVTNSRGIHVNEMRDHVLACMLSTERRLIKLQQQQQSHQWQPFQGGTLHSKTVAILGLGQVGGAIALACRALGMRVLATRAAPEQPGPFDTAVEELTAPDETARLLSVADFVVVCLPATSRTRGLLNSNMLAKMSARAMLIVVGRGGVVDESALARALRDGKLRAAALDVFEREPLPQDDPLWQCPNLIISPHLSGWTHHSVERAIALFIRNIQQLETNQPVLTPVGRARGY